MVIENSTIDSYGNEAPLDKSVCTFLRVVLPKPNGKIEENEPLTHENCDAFELVYDTRHPQVIYYLGDYQVGRVQGHKGLPRYVNYTKFNGITAGDNGDLVESYKACEAIKKWAENTMYLIGEKCVKVIEDNLHKEVEEYCEESKKRLLEELYRLGKEQYEKEKHQNINDKPQGNENN